MEIAGSCFTSCCKGKQREFTSEPKCGTWFNCAYLVRYLRNLRNTKSIRILLLYPFFFYSSYGDWQEVKFPLHL